MIAELVKERKQRIDKEADSKKSIVDFISGLVEKHYDTLVEHVGNDPDKIYSEMFSIVYDLEQCWNSGFLFIDSEQETIDFDMAEKELLSIKLGYMYINRDKYHLCPTEKGIELQDKYHKLKCN